MARRFDEISGAFELAKNLSELAAGGGWHPIKSLISDGTELMRRPNGHFVNSKIETNVNGANTHGRSHGGLFRKSF
ncbi:MAG: hypothetical protein JWN04_5685 [Myxococcaceae bacterium]|nr:hypothetical protein [Myxococcaceae bacterium]